MNKRPGQEQTTEKVSVSASVCVYLIRPPPSVIGKYLGRLHAMMNVLHTKKKRSIIQF